MLLYYIYFVVFVYLVAYLGYEYNTQNSVTSPDKYLFRHIWYHSSVGLQIRSSNVIRVNLCRVSLRFANERNSRVAYQRPTTLQIVSGGCCSVTLIRLCVCVCVGVIMKYVCAVLGCWCLRWRSIPARYWYRWEICNANDFQLELNTSTCRRICTRVYTPHAKSQLPRTIQGTPHEFAYCHNFDQAEHRNA